MADAASGVKATVAEVKEKSGIFSELRGTLHVCVQGKARCRGYRFTCQVTPGRCATARFRSLYFGFDPTPTTRSRLAWYETNTLADVNSLVTTFYAHRPGYLRKKSSKDKWQKRWFEANDHYLTYYKVTRRVMRVLVIRQWATARPPRCSRCGVVMGKRSTLH